MFTNDRIRTTDLGIRGDRPNNKRVATTAQTLKIFPTLTRDAFDSL